MSIFGLCLHGEKSMPSDHKVQVRIGRRRCAVAWSADIRPGPVYCNSEARAHHSYGSNCWTFSVLVLRPLNRYIHTHNTTTII